MITNLLKEPTKLIKLRNRLKKTEEEQEGRKLLLQQLSEAEQLEEEFDVAVQSGSLDSCRIFMDRGIDINHKDLAGCAYLYHIIHT